MCHPNRLWISLGTFDSGALGWVFYWLAHKSPPQSRMHDHLGFAFIHKTEVCTALFVHNLCSLCIRLLFQFRKAARWRYSPRWIGIVFAHNFGIGGKLQLLYGQHYFIYSYYPCSLLHGLEEDTRNFWHWFQYSALTVLNDDYGYNIHSIWPLSEAERLGNCSGKKAHAWTLLVRIEKLLCKFTGPYFHFKCRNENSDLLQSSGLKSFWNPWSFRLRACNLLRYWLESTSIRDQSKCRQGYQSSPASVA